MRSPDPATPPPRTSSNPCWLMRRQRPAPTGAGASRAARSASAGAAAASALLLAACGGGSDNPANPQTSAAQAQRTAAATALVKPGTGAPVANGASLNALPPGLRVDAIRLAQQATFGPTEASINEIRAQGAAPWVSAQMALNTSRYRSGRGDAIHTNTSTVDFCEQPQYASPTCWRDWYSSEPVTWDFYRNAVGQPDQLRQRVAFALSQIAVVSNVEVAGTYGLRGYHNMLLDQAFGNYRDLLRRVTLSPVMGEYLDHVNNDRLRPNENYAREMLQLFSLGTCQLQANGALTGGQCRPVYDNEIVRNYAYALTGWTYAPGGATSYGCYPSGANCQYLGADMVAAPALRDTAARRLLSGVTVPAGATPWQALTAVLDSLMNHPNMAPFVGRKLIQHLVGSNPSAAYLGRVSQAFNSGRYSSGGRTFGAGKKGDLAATVAAVLLDVEARGTRWSEARGGHLREPALLFTGVLRALNGTTDGAALTWWWGDALRQHVFRPPSVFNYYPGDYPVAGTTLVGPEFGIHNANTALERLNYLTFLLEWGGSEPEASVPGATGTRVNLQPFEAQAGDAATLVDNMSLLALGRPLAAAPRNKVIEAVSYWTASTDSANWRARRVAMAAYLVFGSPDYQVQR